MATSAFGKPVEGEKIGNCGSSQSKNQRDGKGKHFLTSKHQCSEPQNGLKISQSFILGCIFAFGRCWSQVWFDFCRVFRVPSVTAGVICVCKTFLWELSLTLCLKVHTAPNSLHHQDMGRGRTLFIVGKNAFSPPWDCKWIKWKSFSKI